MFVLNRLHIWGERELMCVSMWIPRVASIIVFSSQFLLRSSRKDARGFRLQRLKEDLNKDQKHVHIFSSRVNVSSILSLENTEVTKPGLLSLRACGSGSYHLSGLFLKQLLSTLHLSCDKPLSFFSGLLRMLFLLAEMTAALVPSSFSDTELLWDAYSNGPTES